MLGRSALSFIFNSKKIVNFYFIDSCWAFAANGALEAHNFLRKKTGPIPLSEQNLIDCVKGK